MTCARADLDKGIDNLLKNCAELCTGMSLLIVAEPESETYYDRRLVPVVSERAERLGCSVTLWREPFNPVVTDPSPALASAMSAADRVLFMARLGDQLRFRSSIKDRFAVMSYTLDLEMLASPFGRIAHRSLNELKKILDAAFQAAREIRVTCPAGTDFCGSVVTFPGESGETSVRRFPISVFSPISACGFSGVIAQQGFLCATGSQAYEPPACRIDETILVHFDGNRRTDFTGGAKDVARAEAHYNHVAGLFDIDGGFVHSWHAGIHPGLSYPMAPSSNFDRWGGGAFGNPRILHFHTCGAYAPGEISLNIVDPTIFLDGAVIWEDGLLRLERVAGGESLLKNDPELSAAFRSPSREIGLGSSGRLSYTETASNNYIDLQGDQSG